MYHQNVIPFSKAGTFTETRPDGTVVTYEMEVEEFEEHDADRTHPRPEAADCDSTASE